MNTQIKNVSAIIVMFMIMAISPRLSAESRFRGYTLENHIAGPLILEEDLKGKVVIFESWGRRCPPCIASLPHLQNLYNSYGKSNKFVVIGAHRQDRNEAEIVNILSQKKATFPIFQDTASLQSPMNGGIPFAILFDHNGKIVKKGSPNTLYEDARKLVNSMPKQIHPIFSDHKSPYFSKLYSKIMPGNKCEQALETLKKEAESTNENRAKDAKELLDIFQAWRQDQLEIIKLRIDAMPSVAYKYWSQLNLMTPEEPVANSILSELDEKTCQTIYKLYQSYNQAAMIRYQNAVECKRLKTKIVKDLRKFKKQENLPACQKQEIEFLQKLTQKI